MNIFKAYFYLIKSLSLLFYNLLYGIWQLTKLPQAPVTVFGGSGLKHDDAYRYNAHKLVHIFINNKIPVISGSSCLLLEKCFADKHNIDNIMWITVNDKKNVDNCKHKDIKIKSFISRKWILIHYSRGFVVFPGGYGTLSEITELLTLIQTKKLNKVPIILIGKDFWQPFIDWLKDCTLKSSLISSQDFKLLTITDDIEHAFNVIKRNLSTDIVLN